MLSLSNLRDMLMDRLPLIFDGLSAARGDGGVVEGKASSSSTASRAQFQSNADRELLTDDKKTSAKARPTANAQYNRPERGCEGRGEGCLQHLGCYTWASTSEAAAQAVATDNRDVTINIDSTWDT